MPNLLFPWIPAHLAKHAKPVQKAMDNPARNGCDCPCHDPNQPRMMHFMDCCPPNPPPSTLAQQVASAQAEVATWPPGMLERVLPRRD